MNNYFTKRNIFLFTLLAGTLILLLVPLVRFFYFNSLLVGDDSYYHARVARYIIEHGIPEKDDLVIGGRPYIIEPYHVVLSRLGYLLGVEFASQLIPFLSGIVSLTLFYLILVRLRMDNELVFYIIIVLVLSPPFLGVFSYSNPGALAILFTLSGIYFFIREETFYFTLSVFFLVLSAFFSFIAPFIALIVLLSYSLYRKHMQKLVFLLSLIVLLFILFYSSAIYWKYGLPQNFNFLQKNFFHRFLSDMGASLGFSIFSIILCGVGIAFTWEHKRKLFAIYLGLALLLLLTIFNDLPNIYLNFFISVFAGISIHRLIKRKWMLYLIKELTILAIFCGLLFSATSYMSRLATTNPSKDVVESLAWLNVNSKRNEVVLSHFSKGYWIEFLAGRKVLLDKEVSYTPNALDRYEDSSHLFASRNLRETKRVLDQYNITYIWIDDDMKDGLVWSKPNEGLLALLQNNQTFRNIYYEKEIGIWKYLG